MPKSHSQDDAKIVDEIEKTIQKLLNLNILDSLSEDTDKKENSTASDEHNSSHDTK
jgi:hypothetical protein